MRPKFSEESAMILYKLVNYVEGLNQTNSNLQQKIRLEQH